MNAGPRAYLLVRAVVEAPADREPFDSWYAADHLPAAIAAFAALEGRRFWSHSDPSVHYALYAFPNLGVLLCTMESEATRRLIAEFDRIWGGRVTRTRELIEEADGRPS